ncbi:TPA: sulfurtransferase TusA family protein [Aeromonas veronii]|uniref:sulfurtransferase TusA family protein n=1 Tax=Aeromonas veronii TaxID=654 RepID=UPI000DE59254|nr:sulfurtransferase TusA family protein [Aeromonas veronii]MCF5894921.1 sulfurtransferase TusA family protein [Aeromonas veronii]
MEILDLTPWRCPEPLIRLKLWLREAQSGQTVTIRLADAGSRQDIPAYLHHQGHHVEMQQQPDNTLSLQLVVGAKQPS